MAKKSIPAATRADVEAVLGLATTDIITAGHVFFGLGRSAAYEAARRGDLPTIRVGGRILVPVAPLAEKLGLPFNIGRAA